MTMDNINTFLDSEGRIKHWPKKTEKKKAVLQYLSCKFEIGQMYTEKEVNELIKSWHSFNDLFILRRGMIEMGFMCRTKDGSQYWRSKTEIE